MDKRKIYFAYVVSFLVFVAAFMDLSSTYAPTPDQANTPQNQLMLLKRVTATIDGVSQQINLPYTFTDLAPRTEVLINATFTPPEGDSFYISNEYTPLNIYANDRLIYSYGQEGSFPARMFDPALASEIVALNCHCQTVDFAMQYLSPITQDYFTINPIAFGQQEAVYQSLFAELGFSIIFSMVLILTSIFLLFTTLWIFTFERRVFAFSAFALSSFFAGLWLLCDSPLATLFLKNPTQLYITSVYAMAVFPVPLIWFGLSLINIQHKIPLFIVATIEISFAIASIFLLTSGLVSSIIRVEQSFMVWVPLCVSIFALYLLYDYIVYHNPSVRYFVLPSIIFAIFTTLEFINTRFPFTNSSFSFLQTGILMFMFAIGIWIGVAIKDLLTLKEESQRDAFHAQLMEYQAGMLKKHSNLIMETSDKLRKQRHDLRHQLTVIKDLADKHAYDSLDEYLDSVIDNIPTKQIFYCNNATVNSILSHYAASCDKLGITFKVDLDLPSHTNQVQDIDYCVIFGNLLENAVEACQRMEQGERFITLNSHMRYHTLIITMENSFNGAYKKSNGVFRSSKRAAAGIGLTSVQSVAQKHGGDAQYKPNHNIFVSSVYLTT